VDLQAIQATESSPRPTRAKEHIATTPGFGPAGRRAFAHADTRNTSPGCRTCASAPSPAGARPRPPARAEENFARRRAADLAALQKKTSHGCRTSNGFRTFKGLMKKPFAWV